jgi:Domain of unknown function (DUF397)
MRILSALRGEYLMTSLSMFNWQKSSFCANNSCVEVAILDNQVAVRDSKDPDGSILLFTREEWTSFLKGARNGQFEATLE